MLDANVQLKIINASFDLPYLSFVDFMLCSFDSWKSISYSNLIKIINESARTESASHSVIIFFGKYLRVDLGREIKDYENKIRAQNYFDNRRSLFYFWEKYDSVVLRKHSIDIYEMQELGKVMLAQGAMPIIDSPPNVLT